MIRQWQEISSKQVRFNRTYNPDFLTISKGYRIPAKRVDKREDLESSISEMLESEGPFLLEIMIDKEGNVLPMVEPGASVSEVTLTYKH
jgi:acetolactate synthase-1/2/3 large subunit